MIRNFRTALLIGASTVGILGSASAALAADAAEASNASGPVQVEEVIVTAQHRAENLQSVPIAVTAVSASSAEKLGVVNSKDLSNAIPGLQLQQQVNGAVPFLRGVGSTTGAVGNEASVATYVDDVYVSSIVGTLFQFNNVDSIAVLKGPQGTLFGRNATGGVIQVRTRDPSTSGPSADMSVGYANYNTWSGSFYGNVAISDNLAANIALFADDQQDGWGKDLITGEKTFTRKDFGVRAKILWTPTTDTRVLLSADYNDTHNEDGMGFHVIQGSLGVGGTPYAGFYNTYDNANDFAKTKQAGASLKIEQDLHFARLVSITAYRNTRGFIRLDQDATPIPIVLAPIHQQDQTATQELRLLSPAENKIQWILGGFYFRNIAEYDPLALQGLAAAPFSELDIYGRQKSKSIAGFAQATVEVFADTHLTGGIRYTKDDRNIVGHNEGQLGGAVIPLGPVFTQSVSNSEWTYRVALDHQFTPDILGYVSFNRGFKSGVYNLLSFSKPPVDPELLNAYEAGLKTELFDRRLRINMAGFHYDYTNIQVQEIISGATFSLNAAKATINGFDLDFTAAASRNLTISGGFSILDGHYDVFPNGPVNLPTPAVCTPAPHTTGAPTGGNTVCSADLSGNDTVRTPKFSGNISADYVAPTQHGDLDFALSYYYNSGFAWDPDNRVKQDSYGLLGASVGWVAPNQNWGVRFWGRNLTGTKYCSYATATSLLDSCGPAAPRTYGVTVSAHY